MMIDTPGPVAASRADAKRDRILCAALKCFIEHGFHAASMANIAETAQMSAGLIYRYFDNKNAIVLAIVQRQLAEKQAAIRQLQSSEQILDGLAQAFEQWCLPGADTMSISPSMRASAGTNFLSAPASSKDCEDSPRTQRPSASESVIRIDAPSASAA